MSRKPTKVMLPATTASVVISELEDGSFLLTDARGQFLSMMASNSEDGQIMESVRYSLTVIGQRKEEPVQEELKLTKTQEEIRIKLQGIKKPFDLDKAVTVCKSKQTTVLKTLDYMLTRNEIALSDSGDLYANVTA